MRYRIQINSPAHNVHDEFFTHSDINALGVEVIHTDRDRCAWMDIAVARQAIHKLRSSKFRIRCCLVDESGNIQDDYNVPNSDVPVDIFNCHEEIVHRRRLEDGRLIEANLTHNRALKKWYLKINTNPDPAAEGFDQSISGDSPDEVLERFWSNAAIPAFVKQRYIVDDSFLQRPQAEPAVPSPAVPMIEVPFGTEVVGFRPGNAR